jgi:hypothetical protein
MLIGVNLLHEHRVDVLKQAAIVLERENTRLITEVVQLKRKLLELANRPEEMIQKELSLLEEQLRAASQAAEAAISEAAISEDGAEADEGERKKKRKKQTGHGPTAQPSLRIVEDVHGFDQADLTCPACEGVLLPWEGHDDTTEEIDVVEREFVLRKHVVKKVRCKCGCIESAELPPRVVPGGRYSNDFAIECAAMKYVDQIPFDRIARIFGREKLVVDSQTIWDQVAALARWLQPGWSRLRDEALKTGLVGLDQTHWKVIGHKKSWQMWELCTPRMAYFSIAQSKGTDDGLELLKGFKGTVICDALSTHSAIANRTEGIRIAHCWAHPFRYARDAVPTDKTRATKLLELIGKLYKIDEEAGGDLELRAKLRDTESRSVLNDLWAWIPEQRVLPSSPIGKVLTYLTNHRKGFEVFLSDPMIPLDNNSAERGYLWPAIGRRAFIGSRSERGTQVAAIFYSLAESARRNEIDPKAYFRIALEAALATRIIPLPNEIASA